MELLSQLAALAINQELYEWLSAIALALVGLRHLVKLTPTPKDDRLLKRASDLLDKVLGSKPIRKRK